MQRGNFQGIAPLTPVIKKLIILNVAIWLVFVMIGQKFMNQDYVFQWFGLIPGRVFFDFWIWQPISYMFVHSNHIFHVVFNMLALWMLGSDLESKWGGKFFLMYYMVTGIGAGILYVIVTLLYTLIFSGGADPVLATPVIGASGAVFAIMLAYGILFGERVIYFFMVFPMKAKYFVMILGGIEVLNLLNSGMSGQVSNLAHLLGLITGFTYLMFWTRLKGKKLRKSTKKHGRKLRLVVDNERENFDDDKPPKYWN